MNEEGVDVVQTFIMLIRRDLPPIREGNIVVRSISPEFEGEENIVEFFKGGEFP